MMRSSKPGRQVIDVGGESMLSDIREEESSDAGRRVSDPSRVPSWIWDLLIVCLLVGGVVAVHIGIPGPVPSGPDPGNWLALARERLGDSVMAGDASYAPIFPGFLAATLWAFQPVPAIVLAGLVSKAALLASVFVVGRPMGRTLAMVVAVLVGVAGAQLEAYAWGAYPQILATAFGLASVLALVRYLGDRRPLYLLVGIALAAATLGTHLLVGSLLLVAVPIALVHALWVERAGRKAWALAARLAAVIALPGGFYLYRAVVVAGRNGYEPPVNPLGLDLWFSLAHETREAPLLWVIVAILGLVGLVVAHTSKAELATKVVGSSWAFAGLASFLVTGEGRSLLLAQIGLALLGACGFIWLWRRARQAECDTGRRAYGALWRGIAVVGVGVAFGLVVGGVGSYGGTTGWFRVVDTPELDGLDALKAAAEQGDLAMASAGNHGHPIGWWVQGYAGIPTFSGIDLRWLAFPLEREQAQVANDFFAQVDGGLEALEPVRAVGVDFLVVDRRGPDAGWLESPIANEFERIYESPTIVVLSFPTREAASET